MKDIKGLIINHLDFIPVKLGDFLYYEGPLLSHFIDKNNPSDNYFYRWVDCDDNAHRWLIFKANETDIRNFFAGIITLWQMITKSSTVILMDLDDNLAKKQILVTTISELPTNYLPAEKSYFKEENYQPYATELKNQLNKKIEDQNLLVELVRKVDMFEEQQQKTFKLLTDVFFSLKKSVS